MASFLKQSTAFTFRIGPFLDSTDGVTAETALSIGQADIQISKAGGAFAQTSASPTTTHDADGWYQCPLTATDTGTLGTLTVQIVMAGALPVWKDFMVLPANVYDSMVAGSDNLQVDTIQIGGTTQTANDVGADVDAILVDTAEIGAAGAGLTEAGGTGDHLTALASAADLATVDGIVDAILVDTAEIGAAGAGLTALASAANLATVDANVDAILLDTAEIGAAGAGLTALATAASIAALNDLSAAEVNAEVDTALADIHLDHLLAVDYDPASKPGTATALFNELVESDAGVSRFTVNSLENAPSGTGASAASIADAVWDEARSGHVTAGTFGEAFRGTVIGTAQSGTTSTIQLASGAVASDDELNGATVRIVGGTGAGQSGRYIDDSTAATDNCNVSPNWDTAPDGTSVYEIIHTAPASTASLPSVNVTQWSGSAVATPSVAGVPEVDITHISGTAEDVALGSEIVSAASIADAVWDEAKAGHVAAGSFGEEVQAHALSTEISALNDPSAASIADAVWDEAQADHTTAGTFGELATEIAAILADTGTDGVVISTTQAQAIADAILGRNIAGGSSSGRTVTSALRRLRNRVAISGGTMTVYQENDTTSDWTGAVTTTAGNPVSEIDPA